MLIFMQVALFASVLGLGFKAISKEMFFLLMPLFFHLGLWVISPGSAGFRLPSRAAMGNMTMV
jgi:hypothetical protein